MVKLINGVSLIVLIVPNASKRPGVESDGIGGVGGGMDAKKGDYSPFWGTEGFFVS
jgi:hypothetical protein